MKIANLRPIFFWAMRDLWRRPLESCLLTAVLLFTVTITASPLLLTHALSNSWEKILKRAPSMPNSIWVKRLDQLLTPIQHTLDGTR